MEIVLELKDLYRQELERSRILLALLMPSLAVNIGLFYMLVAK